MWWNKTAPTVGRKAVAYYRHSAEDRQEYSIPIQKTQVHKFAQEHGIEIVKEFADYGKSGLSTKGRDEFTKMLELVADGSAKFDYVLALDVTRWGRFQDLIMSLYYMGLCQQYGRKVVFTTFGDIPREDDLGHYVRLSLEGFMAAHYSRELSDKVFKGCMNIAGHGWRAGGPAPYALQRLLLDEQGRPVQVLRPGQRKSIQNQRVTLQPGDKNEVAVVRRIFTDLGKKQTPPRDIAKTLNCEGIPSPHQKKWTADAVRSVLGNELYVGTMVYNKTTQKLQSTTKRNPRSEWIRVENAFPGIVEGGLFQRAQAILDAQEHERLCLYSDVEMLTKLKTLYEQNGLITARQISVVREMPTASTYSKHFASLDGAFQRMYPEALDRAKGAVLEELKGRLYEVRMFGDYLVLNNALSLVVQPSVPIPSGYSVYWSFQPDPRVEVDITLGVPLSDTCQGDILAYLMFPRVLVGSRPVRIFGSSESKLALYGYANLDIIGEILHGKR